MGKLKDKYDTHVQLFSRYRPRGTFYVLFYTYFSGRNILTFKATVFQFFHGRIMGDNMFFFV